MMKPFLLAALAPLLFVVPALAQLPPAEAPPPTPHTDEKTGLVFPIDKHFRREPPHKYEDPNAGFSVHYEFELPEEQAPTPNTPQGARVTFYVYNAGLEQIAAGAESPEIAAQFLDSAKAVHAAKERGAYRAVEEDPVEVVRIGDAAKGPQFRRAAFRITGKDGKQFVSQLYMTGYANHLVKIRVSIPKRQVKEGEKEVARLLAAFAASMKP